MLDICERITAHVLFQRVTGGATAEKQSIRDISFHSATISKRPRRSRLSNKKDLSEIAAQLLLSPR